MGPGFPFGTEITITYAEEGKERTYAEEGKERVKEEKTFLSSLGTVTSIGNAQMMRSEERRAGKKRNRTEKACVSQI